MPDLKIIKLIFSKRMLLTLVMGFASGLPLLLTIGVLQAWMKQFNVSLEVIGLVSLVQIPYTWKVIWAPVMDRFVIPVLGRRRGWLFAAQVALIFSIAFLGFSDPVKRFPMMIVAALMVAFFSATQDIVVDA